MMNVDLSQLAIDRSEATVTGGRSRMRLVTRYLLPALLILGFLILIAWASRDLVFPRRPVTIIPVMATQAEGQPAGTPLFNAAGWIEPRPTTVRAAALAPGVVEQLLVVEDQPVKAGQPVAELIQDDARLAYERMLADLKLRQAERNKALASLEAARTRFEQPVHLQQTLFAADAALAKSQREVMELPHVTDRAEAQLAFAEQDYAGKVAAKEAVAGRDIDEALSERETARARVKELGQRETALKSEVAALVKRRDALQTQLELLADEIQARDEAEAHVQAASARVEQAEAELAEAKLRWDRMTVRAPIDGRVYQLIAHPGARIGSGMTQMEGHDGSTVVTLYRPESLQVRVDVRFEDIPKVLADQPVRIKSAAVAEPLVGRVLFVSSEADDQKNTLEVKVAIESPPSVFKPEMLVDVTFLSPERDQASQQQDDASARPLRIFLPQSLIKQGDGGAFVWLADQTAGTARRTPVKTGIVGSNGLVEVTGGLSISSRIIASGGDGLRDGQRIRVTGEEGPGNVSQ